MSLLHMIENHLHHTGTAHTRFGRQVMGDPRFVHDLRNGRRPRIGTEIRIIDYLLSRSASGRTGGGK